MKLCLGKGKKKIRICLKLEFYSPSLYIENQSQMSESKELSFVQTKFTALNKGAVNNFQVVVHNTKRKKADRRTREDNIELSKIPETQKEEVDMKKARYEVFKFAMSGLKADQKQEAKEALAIQLGAKPPRNKCYNYKEYKQMKEKQRKEQLQQQTLLSVGKTKSGNPVFKGNKKKIGHRKIKTKKDGILDPYGKPGKVTLSAKKKKL